VSRNKIYILFIIQTLFFVQISYSLPIQNIDYKKYNGKLIRSVTVHIGDIFSEKGFLYQTANSLKIKTKEQVVKRELMFSEGMKFDDFSLLESKRNLRRLNFLRDIDIKIVPEGSVVDVHVYAKDAWTLVPQAGASNSGGKKSSSIGLSESNLLGYFKELDILWRETDERSSTEFSYLDPRIFGTYNSLLTSFADREDGSSYNLSLSQPFRSLLNKTSWLTEYSHSDFVGRLFDAGEESYIYRLDTSIFRSRYIFAIGDPETLLRRISFGFDSLVERFSTADLEDYDALNLDPLEVSNDPSLLAQDRVYRGFVVGYRSITPDYIPVNYIDRFDRVEDYNLGAERLLEVLIAPSALGSSNDSIHPSISRSGGIKFSNTEFLRAEVGASSRIEQGDFRNNLIRAEAKYFNVLGNIYAGDLFFGKHTLAFNTFLDYGSSFDNDRQLLLGSDEGGLRGYRARAFGGNKRFVVNLEDRIHLVEDIFDLISLGAATFVDIGGATSESLSRLVQDNIYADVGVGLRIGFPRSSGGGVARIDVGVPLRSARDGSDQFSPRIMFSAGQAFDARLRGEETPGRPANSSIGFGR
jgi:hypothetical protein